MIDFTTRARSQLERSASVIELLCTGITDEGACWHPGEDRWSLTEIIHHLFDEEREDFRSAIDIILFHPERPWPAIDPMGWVRSRNYNESSAEDLLSRFIDERADSLDWLRTLNGADWDSPHPGPGGPNTTTAGNTLAAWVAHDLVHIHQISDWRRDNVDIDFAPYTGSYAGSLS